MALREELHLTGSLGLDFVNTVVPVRTGPVDLLHHPDGFLWWMGEAMPPALQALAPGDPSGRRLLTGEARHLRDALIALFAMVADDSEFLPPEATATLDRALQASVGRYTRAGVTVERHFDDGHPLAVLTPIALSALDFAASARRDRLRPCAAEGCQRWFLDTSKSGRRRWCTMERCGNRAKAERYRRRHAGPE